MFTSDGIKLSYGEDEKKELSSDDCSQETKKCCGELEKLLHKLIQTKLEMICLVVFEASLDELIKVASLNMNILQKNRLRFGNEREIEPCQCVYYAVSGHKVNDCGDKVKGGVSKVDESKFRK